MVDNNTDKALCYWFDSYALEIETRTLFRERAVIQTPDKTILLLHALLQRPGQVLAKDELIATIWPNQDVSDWSLSRLVSDTRQLLGENARDQGLIQTIRGRGFRLNPDIEVRLDEPPNLVIRDLRRGRRRWLPALIAALLIALTGTSWWLLHDKQRFPVDAGQLTIVLPVSIETGDDQDSWVAYGVMTVLTGQLQRFPELNVADVESSLRSLDQIGYEPSRDANDLYSSVCEPLGCEHVISTRLVLNDSGIPELVYRIQSGDRRSPEYGFANEDILQASNAMFDHLIQQLMPPQPERVVVDGMYTDNAQANQNFALGASSVLRGDYDSAENYLQMALELKPDFFWARAYMLDALVRKGEAEQAELLMRELSASTDDLRAALFLAKVRSNLDYRLGELQSSIAEGDAMLALARELGDGQAEGLALMNNGATWQALGEYEKAEENLLLALQVFRDNRLRLREAQTLFNLGNVHYSLRANDEAIQYYSKAADMFRRQGAIQYLSFVRFALAGVKMTLGRLDQAEIELREVGKLYDQLGDAEGVLLVQSELGHIELMRGNLGVAEQLLLSAFETAGDTYTYVRSWASGLLTVCYLNMGLADRAGLFIDERERFDWFDARIPMVFVAASHAHLKGDFGNALQLALQAKARVGAEWTPEHEEWLTAFRRASESGRPVITDYYALQADTTR